MDHFAYAPGDGNSFCSFSKKGVFPIKITSWNVNGIASCRRQGFLKFLGDTKPDIMCCQETKATHKIKMKTPGYYQYWNHAERSGYAGTLVLTRKEPLSYAYGWAWKSMTMKVVYCFEAFWYDDTSDLSSPMWQSEGFPVGTFQLSETVYNITNSWTSQGYKIKSLQMESNRIVFRRVNRTISGIKLPRALTDQRLPDEIVYNFNKMVRQFIKDNAL